MEQNFRRGGDFPLLFTQPRTKPIFGNQLFYCLKLQPTDQPTDLLTASTRINTCPFEPKVDGEVRTIAIDVLKQLIGRLETEKNPMNIIPVGEAK